MKEKDIDKACLELQRLQRERAYHLKSRIMVYNRLQAAVAGQLGYCSALKEGERLKLFKRADEEIKKIASGEASSNGYGNLVLPTMMSVDTFGSQVDMLEEEMHTVAKTLPTAAWVEEPEQRGFGIHLFAVLIGETGNLANYPLPGKLWKRMGCAPYEVDGVMHMGSTWRKPGLLKKNGTSAKMHAENWTEFGYSKRRRSIAYLIGENLMKINKSIYRKRYEVTKERFAEKHEGTSKMHCHLHGMLLATKLLMKNLWMEWNPDMVDEAVGEYMYA